MCGITAYVGEGDPVETVLTGLRNLEYRGYDSAGFAVSDGHSVDVVKREGTVDSLVGEVGNWSWDGEAAIGHTRWSTHGPPTDANAHPHTDCSGDIAVVHNGIVENYDELRAALVDAGHGFDSETDTEVIPHLVEAELADSDVETAFRTVTDRLEGSFALTMLHAGSERVYATRQGSPLVLGVGGDGYYLASDVPAFLEYTDEVVYPEDGDVLTVSAGDYHIAGPAGRSIERPHQTVDWAAEDAQKQPYDHYMKKEIHEQPTAIDQSIRGRLSEAGVELDDLDGVPFADVTDVCFVACGTSYHAALYGTQLLDERGIPARAVLASEFAASPPETDDRTLVVGVTQSGETADTLAALRAARKAGRRTLAVTNVVSSTAARECESCLYIRAGPEIGVAATKTFASQLTTLLLLAERLAAAAGNGESMSADLRRSLRALPEQVQTVLDTADAYRLAETYAGSTAYFFIGRGLALPVAMEGALKLKEISYEHAEGFAAGELKHGPLALVTPETPVFAISDGQHTERTVATVEEVQARGAPVVAVGVRDSPVADVADSHLPVPGTDPELVGLLANVQLQLFAYHAARLLDRPVDKPRNLAKSVTVE